METLKTIWRLGPTTLLLLLALVGPYLLLMAQSIQMPRAVAGRGLYAVGRGDEFILEETHIDSLTGRATTTKHRVALFGVYPPQKRKANLCAKKALEAQIEDQDVSCQWAAPDHAGRFVATCSVSGRVRDVGKLLADRKHLISSCVLSLGRYACEYERAHVEWAMNIPDWFISLTKPSPHIPPAPSEAYDEPSATEPLEPWEITISEGKDNKETAGSDDC